MKNKLHQQVSKILRNPKHNHNETVQKVQKHFWTRRGLLRQAVISVSVVTISLFGHSILKPEKTIANPRQGRVATASLPGRARLIIVFILDGLRPDSINPQDTPNPYKSNCDAAPNSLMRVLLG